MRQTSRLVLIALFALVAPATAAIDRMAGSMHMDTGPGDLDQWQRTDLRSSGVPLRKMAQVKVAIRT